MSDYIKDPIEYIIHVELITVIYSVAALYMGVNKLFIVLMSLFLSVTGIYSVLKGKNFSLWFVIYFLTFVASLYNRVAEKIELVEYSLDSIFIIIVVSFLFLLVI